MAGCASHQSAAYQVARSIVRPNADIDSTALNPALRYLRVTTNGKSALMVLGYTDVDASGQPVQVWYSALGEVLRLQEGRLKGLTGTPVEWRAVVWPARLPSWQQALAAATPLVYERQRDEMPGYRLSVKEQLQLHAAPAQGSTELQGVAPADLQWFTEASVDGRLPPARYGVRMASAAAGGQAEPVYGEQCLNTILCLAWQTWPAVPGSRP